MKCFEYVLKNFKALNIPEYKLYYLFDDVCKLNNLNIVKIFFDTKFIFRLSATIISGFKIALKSEQRIIPLKTGEMNFLIEFSFCVSYCTNNLEIFKLFILKNDISINEDVVKSIIENDSFDVFLYAMENNKMNNIFENDVFLLSCKYGNNIRFLKYFIDLKLEKINVYDGLLQSYECGNITSIRFLLRQNIKKENILNCFYQFCKYSEFNDTELILTLSFNHLKKIYDKIKIKKILNNAIIFSSKYKNYQLKKLLSCIKI